MAGEYVRQRASLLIEVLLARQSMTQRDLARKVGVTFHYVNLVINCHRSASTELLIKISEALNIPRYDFFGVIYGNDSLLTKEEIAKVIGK